MKRKRFLAALLSVIMVLTMIPATAFAGAITEDNVKNAEDNPSAYDYDESAADSVTVTVTLSNDGIPLQGQDADQTDISHLEVTVPYFDLADYGLESYYRYETDESGSYASDTVVERPTVLHLYIYLAERFYLGLDEEDCCQGDDVSGVMSFSDTVDVRYFDDSEAYTSIYSAIYPTGGATSIFLQDYFGHDCNLMYYRNHKYPLMKAGWGSTADYMVLSDGDDIDIAMFSNWEFYSNGWFLAFGKEIYNTDPSSELTVQTYGTTTSGIYGGYDSPIEECDGSMCPVVYLYDDSWNVIEDVYVEDNEDGSYTFTAPETAGTYYLMALDENCDTSASCCAPATAKIIVNDGSGDNDEQEQAAAALAKAKTDAKAEIEGYKDASDYREAQQAELAAAIDAAKEAIDAAADESAVAEALEAAKAEMDKIKTGAQLDQEEAEAVCDHEGTVVIDEAVAPTCTENGLTEGKHCSKCGEVIVAQLPVLAVHHPGEWTVSKIATATEPGEEITSCTVCKEKLTRQIPCNENILAAGECGDRLAWILSAKGTLMIYGSGAMKDYAADTDGISTAPWASHVKDIRALVIEDGVTSIGAYAFTRCDKFEGELGLPANLESIGTDAFSGCGGFEGEVKTPETLKTIGDRAFKDCAGIDKIVIPNEDCELGEDCVDPEGVTIAAPKNSKAEQYAKDNGIQRETLPTNLLGDANGDGLVDSTDAMLICQYDAWMIDETGIALAVCDVNGDGLVDSTDAMLICQYDAWMIDKFPVSK